MKSIRLLAFAFLLAISAQTAHAGPGMTIDRLDLRVVDANGTPVPNVQFSLFGVQEKTSFLFSCMFQSGALTGSAPLICTTNEETRAVTFRTNADGMIRVRNQSFSSLSPIKRTRQIYVVYEGAGEIPNCGWNRFRSEMTGEVITERVIRLDAATLDSVRNTGIVCKFE